MSEYRHVKLCGGKLNKPLLFLLAINIDLYAIWKCLFTDKVTKEKATLYQMSNVIICRNVSAKPKADVNALKLRSSNMSSPLQCHIFMLSMEDEPMCSP